MTKKTIFLIVLMLIFSACPPLIGPKYNPELSVEFDMNGLYRGKIDYGQTGNQNTRFWGNWIEVKINHITKYRELDLPDDRKLPMSGSVKTFDLMGVKFEEYKMEGKFSIDSVGGYHNAQGSIEMLDDNGNGTGTFYNFKITHFEANTQGNITVCSSIPNRVPLKSCGSGKNDFIRFQFFHTSPFYEKETEVLEKCCGG